MLFSTVPWKIGLLIVAACVLTACGGGGGGSTMSPQTAPATTGGGGSGGQPQETPRSAVAVGQSYTYQPNIPNPGTFSATNLPNWLTLNPTTGQLSGTPTAADIGTYSGITITASNGWSVGPFSITVAYQGGNTASLSWMPPASNSDGSSLTDLTGYTVQYGPSPWELNRTIEITNPSITTYLVENLTAGTWYFTIQARTARGTRSDLASTTKTII